MKKILSVLLCLLVLLSAVSCFKDGEGDKKENVSSDITSSDVVSSNEYVTSTQKGDGDSESKITSNNTSTTGKPNNNNQTTNTQSSDKTSSQIKDNSSKDNSSSKPNSTGTTQTNKGELEIGDREGFRGVDNKIIIENDYWGYQGQEGVWPESACAYENGEIIDLQIVETTISFTEDLNIPKAKHTVKAKYVVHNNSVYMYAKWWDNSYAPRPYFVRIPGDSERVIVWINGKAFIYNVTTKKFTKIREDIEQLSMIDQGHVSDDGKYLTIYKVNKIQEQGYTRVGDPTIYVYNIKTGESTYIPMVEYDKNVYSNVSQSMITYSGDKAIFANCYQQKNEVDRSKWFVRYTAADVKTGELTEYETSVDTNKYTQMLPNKPYQFLLENSYSINLYNLKTNEDYSFIKASGDEFSDMVVSEDRYIFARYKNAKKDSWETVIIDMKNGKLINVDEVAKAYGSGTYKGYDRTAARWISDTTMFVSYTDAKKHYYEIIDFKDYI